MRLLVVLALVGALGIIASPVSAAAGSCADRFPETSWVEVSSGAVSVEATGVRPGFADRFNREVKLVEGWLNDDIGPFSATVCLVDNESAFDTSPYVQGSQRLHARMEMDDGLLLLSTQRIGLVGPAVAFGLTHHALWQHGQEGGHPEPLSSVIGQWYRARILDRLELYHRDVMVENFFDTEAVIDWTESSQPAVRDWDPEQNFQAVGDFIDFAVAQYGTEVLLETDGERWSEIEGEWRTALRVDLTGRTTPTTEWIVGITLVVVALVVATSAAALGIWSKRRKRRRAPTASPIPGFFSDS
ncbi:MAG: hypothetical protein ACR2N2_11960 [Acidimicrobiia bacterium]